MSIGRSINTEHHLKMFEEVVAKLSDEGMLDSFSTTIVLSVARSNMPWHERNMEAIEAWFDENQF
jgi:hypothetical protein